MNGLHFDLLNFLNRKYIYRVWRKKVDRKRGPSHLCPDTNFLFPKALLQYSRKYTNTHTYIFFFSHFYMDRQPMYILFYILICFTLTMSWNSFCISTRRRASLFFLQLYSIPLSGCVKICLTGSLGWVGGGIQFVSHLLLLKYYK